MKIIFYSIKKIQRVWICTTMIFIIFSIAQHKFSSVFYRVPDGSRTFMSFSLYRILFSSRKCRPIWSLIPKKEKYNLVFIKNMWSSWCGFTNSQSFVYVLTQTFALCNNVIIGYSKWRHFTTIAVPKKKRKKRNKINLFWRKKMIPNKY